MQLAKITCHLCGHRLSKKNFSRHRKQFHKNSLCLRCINKQSSNKNTDFFQQLQLELFIEIVTTEIFCFAKLENLGLYQMLEPGVLNNLFENVVLFVVELENDAYEYAWNNQSYILNRIAHTITDEMYKSEKPDA